MKIPEHDARKALPVSDWRQRDAEKRGRSMGEV